MQQAQTVEHTQPKVSIKTIAYISAILWAVRLLGFFVPALRDATATSAPLLSVTFCILGIAAHLSVFPLVEALPAPRWARAAGYGWLVIDMATQIMQFSGTSPAMYLALKYGGHISAAAWLSLASWQGKGAMRVIGLLFALNLAVYSFVFPYDPTHFIGLLPSLVLNPVWFALIGRMFAKQEAQEVALTIH